MMFRTLLALILVLSAWTNSTLGSVLEPRGEKAGPLTLAVDAKAAYTIIIPAEPLGTDRKAADELRIALKEITGAEFSITTESPSSATSKIISIGRTKLLQASKTPHEQDLGWEGYGIGVDGDNLLLWGGSKRGAINAVMCLLEEDLGVRWFKHKQTDYPRLQTLTFQPTPRTFVPPFASRIPYYYSAMDEDWMIHNRVMNPKAVIPQEWGGNLSWPANWFVHTFQNVLEQQRDFEAHPEYFSIIKGKRNRAQLCLSNPQVFDLTLAKVREALAKSPEVSMVDISQYDGDGHCECEKCSVIDKENGSPAGSTITFLNRIAETLEKERPDIVFTTLAYLDTIMPPSKVRPRHNVGVQLCNNVHAWHWPLQDIVSGDTDRAKQFRSAVAGWTAICDKVLIWDYTANYSHLIAPMPNMHVIQPAIDFYLKSGVKGVMFQSAGHIGERDQMRGWVMAKALWDPSRRVDALVQEFISGYYRESAEPIRKYYAMLDEAGRANAKVIDLEHWGAIRFNMRAPFLSKAFIDRATALMDESKRLAKSEEILHRVELEELPLTYVKLSRGLELVAGRRDYARLLAEFDRVAHRERVFTIKEGAPDLDDFIKHCQGIAVDSSRMSIAPLSNEWLVQKDPDKKGDREKWFAPTHATDGWKTLRSDSNTGWESQGFGDYEGIGWYRQTVEVPTDYILRKNNWLVFGAVDEDATIYLDGKQLTEHTCESTKLQPEEIWETPFKVNVGSLMPPGSKHVLTVKVFNRAGMGGVWKPVSLVSSDEEVEAQTLVGVVEAARTEKK